MYGVSRFLGDWWLEKQKARYSKELEEFKDRLQREQKRMQAEVDRSVFVTRAHFETEYQAMKEVSQSLSEVKILYRRLNPVQAGVELGDTERIRLIERLEEANEDYLRKLEEWTAFLEPKVYDEFSRCHIGADEELKRLRTNSPFEKNKTLNAQYFWTSYSQACQHVRDRIKSLAVLPGT